MGMFGKLLLTIWLMGGTAGSIYLLGRRFVEMGMRVVQLHNETCLEDPVLWPTWLMTLILVSCVLGLMGIVCKLKLFQWLFSILINLGVIYVIAIMVWRLLMFGWIRKPTSMSFEEVYKNNSPLDDEYKSRLIQAMASDNVWEDVNECLTEIQFCEEAKGPEKFFANDDWKIEEFYEYYREGCCKAPPRCAQKLISLKEVSETDDCMKWANATLKKPTHAKCYNCNSCKAARLATYQADQDKVRIYTLLAAVFMFVANMFVSMGGFD
ncbi:tetraspanin-8-like [Rutidosis leptorrhynchoides]|uniref:tetraspanin-8-like n=1 Tax=Rutidosis leptorrhynchoides TaxID=125765 RepID=UPI003A994771